MAIPKVHLKKIKRKKEITYQIDYRVNGRRIRKSVGPNKQTAELIQTQLQRDFLLGTYNLPISNKTSHRLEDLITEFIQDKKNRVRSSTLKRYKNYFDRLLKFMNEYFPGPAEDISLITTTYFNKFVAHTLEDKDGYKQWNAATTNDAIKLIRALFKLAQNQGYITKNVLEQIRPVRENSSVKADYFTSDDLNKIYATIDPHWVDAIKFIANTGLRKGELTNLRWSSVDCTKDNERITVEGCDDWDTKTGKSRIIPLNKEAIAVLNRQKGKNKEFVFSSKEGGQIPPDDIYHALKNALEKLKLNGTVHTLRHTFASHLSLKGVDVLAIRDLLGHADIQTTQIYTHLPQEHLANAVNKLN